MWVYRGHVGETSACLQVGTRYRIVAVSMHHKLLPFSKASSCPLASEPEEL